MDELWADTGASPPTKMAVQSKSPAVALLQRLSSGRIRWHARVGMEFIGRYLNARITRQSTFAVVRMILRFDMLI